MSTQPAICCSECRDREPERQQPEQPFRLYHVRAPHGYPLYIAVHTLSEMQVNP